ncbi:MAG: TonB family protein [Spirochaetales bacterium]|nr:TonB family protein [Spirochaetales bacterium]
MAYSTYKQSDRLKASLIFSILIYGVVFVIFQFIITLPVSPPDEYAGPIFVNLEPETMSPLLKEKETVKREEVKTTVKEEKTAVAKTENKKVTEPLKKTTVTKKDTTVTNKKTADSVSPIKKNEVKSNTTPIDNTTKGKITEEEKAPVTEQGTESQQKTVQTTKKKEEESALNKENMSELDKALNQNDSGTTKTDSSKTSANTKDLNNSSPTNESGINIQWEDNKNRTHGTIGKPIIPDWVSKQGLQLKVVISFTLTPKGTLTGFKPDPSCGYTDVDNAVIDVLRKLKFEAIPGAQTVKGKITYIITPQ